jgi:hypothetical protein
VQAVVAALLQLALPITTTTAAAAVAISAPTIHGCQPRVRHHHAAAAAAAAAAASFFSLFPTVVAVIAPDL